MYGAILGDIIGSPYEFDAGEKTKEFPLFSENSVWTDDTVMTIAVADAFQTAGLDASEEALRQQLDAVTRRVAALREMLEALEIAQQTLDRATQELQRRFAPQISQRAQELFGKLTGGRYNRLFLDDELTVYTGAEEETTTYDARWRSDGTADQLYLALRLAVSEVLTPDAPLVLDDALVRFDDDRLRRALEVLERSAETKQVLLFTCQKREAAVLSESEAAL